jgi:hypothetical protein
VLGFSTPAFSASLKKDGLQSQLMEIDQDKDESTYPGLFEWSEEPPSWAMVNIQDSL